MVRLKVRDVTFDYDGALTLRDVKLSINESEVLTLLGPNGSGKTTLLRCMNAILKPKKGTVLVDGRNCLELHRTELARIMGYVPQRVERILPLTVFDVVLLGRKPHVSWTPSREDLSNVSNALKLLKIENLSTRYFNQLSSGEMQKVRIAVAIAQDPEIILFDEPTANLDLRHKLEVMEIIVDLAKRKGVTVITAMHDVNLASRFSDKIALMKEGSIFAVGEPNAVITRKNMMEVYGVEVIVDKSLGWPRVTPIKSITS